LTIWRCRWANCVSGPTGRPAAIIDQLGTQEVPRLRIGIGGTSGGMINHVLGRFTPGELPEVEAALDRAVEAIEFAQNRGLQAAMNHFN